MACLTVTQIYVYPLKSTAAVSVAEARVAPRGLVHDRRFMVVDPNGECLTGREIPALTQVQAKVESGQLHLRMRGHPDCVLRIAEPATHDQQVEIWGQRCSAAALDPAADAWLESTLGRPCRLVEMTTACERPVDSRYGYPGDLVSFADGYPLLLTSEASLADLNRRLNPPVSMLRFRPNLVVAGCEAFDEDGWRRIRIGEVEFEGVKACARCVFTTIDPKTAERHPHQEPLRTLSTYRRRPEGGVFFGQNLIPRGEGMVRIGDFMELLNE